MRQKHDTPIKQRDDEAAGPEKHQQGHTHMHTHTFSHHPGSFYMLDTGLQMRGRLNEAKEVTKERMNGRKSMLTFKLVVCAVTVCVQQL